MNYFKDWTLFEKSWLAIFTVINIYLFFAWSDTVIGLLASLTGMMCVVLVAKGKTSNYYFGIVNILLYSYIAYQSKYYGEVSLNMGYYLPMSILGLWFWKKNERKETNNAQVIIRRLYFEEKIALPLTVLIGTGMYCMILKTVGGNLPLADAASTVLSVCAMVLMVRRVVEQWLLWIVVDIISIYLWLTVFLKDGNDISMLVMWSAFLVNAVYGYYNWNKMAVTND